MAKENLQDKSKRLKLANALKTAKGAKAFKIAVNIAFLAIATTAGGVGYFTSSILGGKSSYIKGCQEGVTAVATMIFGAAPDEQQIEKFCEKVRTKSE